MTVSFLSYISWLVLRYDFQGPTANPPSMAMAKKVMQVLRSYSINCNGPGVESRNVEAFLPTIATFIEKKEPVCMVLPAFPFKSPNSQDKVMGVLPDLGEELALQHLNALCQNVGQVYEPGAEVHITSDGLVYNGIWALINISLVLIFKVLTRTRYSRCYG